VKRVHLSIKKAPGLRPAVNDAELLRDWKRRTSSLCKPCWELHYCPYGPVVEDFPLLPPIKSEAEDHNEYLRSALRSGRLANGQPLDSYRRKVFQRMLARYKASDHPEIIPRVMTEASCKVFGHLCPVFFVAEPLTETRDRRSHSRAISREVMLKVVRRDGQICQRCHEPVRDDEVEFDHIIPFSKGGRSTAENLRLVHRDCNRRKSDSLGEVRHPRPIQHLLELQSRNRKR
jgi:5-methylcytosine-specific restriction endonuclease McrA